MRKKRKTRIPKRMCVWKMALCIMCIAGLLSGCGKQSEQLAGEKDMEQDSYESVQQFSYSLMTQNLQEKNPVLSPVSAYLALAMAGNGADGETAEEFGQVLGTDMTKVSCNLIKALPKKEEKTKLSISDSAWMDQELIPEEDWLAVIKDVFHAEAYRAKLSSDEAMEQINAWVEQRTNGLIPGMLEEPLPQEARLALFNTVYFYADWQTPFQAEATYEQEFYKEDGSTAMVDMMHRREEYEDYWQNERFEGIFLPYADETLAFVALKPTDGSTVRELYAELAPERLSQLLKEKQNGLVTLELPKYEITFDKVLNEELKQMGLQQAFDGEKADFTKLGRAERGGNLYISLVRQKAVIRVDEKGTEAAAATELAMCEMTALRETEPVHVCFDEPFVYMIWDTETEVPVFIGIMDEP